jgi:hypothetical protein
LEIKLLLQLQSNNNNNNNNNKVKVEQEVIIMVQKVSEQVLLKILHFFLKQLQKQQLQLKEYSMKIIIIIIMEEVLDLARHQKLRP